MRTPRLKTNSSGASTEGWSAPMRERNRDSGPSNRTSPLCPVSVWSSVAKVDLTEGAAELRGLGRSANRTYRCAIGHASTKVLPSQWSPFFEVRQPEK